VNAAGEPVINGSWGEFAVNPSGGSCAGYLSYLD